MAKLKFNLPIIFFILGSISGCVSYKNLFNLQTRTTNAIINYKKPEYFIQSVDILDIKVSSADEQSIAIFDKTIAQSSTNILNDASVYITGYVVNEPGFISFPIIGNVKATDLKIGEVTGTRESKLKEYYKLILADAKLKLMNFRVTIPGEVNPQGEHNVYNEKTDNLPIIYWSDGITDLGYSTRVKIIRKEGGESALT